MKKLLNNRKLSFLLFASVVFSISACNKDKNNPTPVGDAEAIALECDFFKEDRVLTHNPDAAVDYIIGCEAKVTGDLVVEPGVVIAFKENASLYFQEESSLQMIGTADKPIVLTGITKEKGLWRGMLILSNKASNTMKYVTIEYAGSTNVSHSGDISPAGLQILGDGDVSIDNCLFQNCKDNGIYWKGSKYVSITNSKFKNNDVPMKTRGNNQIKLYNNTNDYKGNVNDYVHMEFPGFDNNNQEIVWHEINVPYFVTTRIYNRFDVNKADLIIEPGVDVIMATADTHVRILGDASIRAIGTAAKPIVFRGRNDVKGSWSHILVSSSNAMNEIAHVEIKNAGDLVGTPSGALRVDWGSYLNAHDISFIKNVDFAVTMYYTGGMTHPIIEYANLILDETPRMFGDGHDNELTDPNDPTS